MRGNRDPVVGVAVHLLDEEGGLAVPQMRVARAGKRVSRIVRGIGECTHDAQLVTRFEGSGGLIRRFEGGAERGSVVVIIARRLIEVIGRAVDPPSAQREQDHERDDRT